MRKMVVKFIACVMSLVFCMGWIPGELSDGKAYASENGAISIPMTIQERSGVAVQDYLFRRGIAIEEGLLYSPEGICITENGSAIPSAAEVLETYEDGSIRWLLVTGIINLRPNEHKKLLVVNGESAKRNATYQKTASSLQFHSKNIDFTIGQSGIESLKYNGAEQLNAEGINLYVTVGGKTDFMKANNFEVVKHTATYSKFKISGILNTDIEGEMVITIAKDAKKLQIDHRIIAKHHLAIERIGLTVGARYPQGSVGEIVNSDFLNLGTMQLATYDDTRFNGATTKAENTGYVISENAVLFAPLINGDAYTYYDGMARTCHLHITFDADGESWAKMLSMPPNIFADPKQYEKAGAILSTTVSPVVQEFIERLNKGYEHAVGDFLAGGLTTWYRNKNYVSIAINIPGEVEYNYGMGYMQTGNEELFRQMVDISEIRCDIAVYKGMHEDLHGAMRARVSYSASGTSFCQSHAYYSDEGGLYMTYVLTGDEYVYDNFKLCIYKTLNDMYARLTNDTHHVEYWYWGDGSNPTKIPNKGTFVESRGMIRARTLYLASRFFHDKRFYDAAYAVVNWAKNAQLDNGEFSQVTQNTGVNTYQTIPAGGRYQYPVKNYVNMMGFRGISQMLDFEEDSMTLEVVCKYADALCVQGEKFGPVLMNPHSDIDVYEMNEDSTRTTDLRANILAVDVLCTAFEHTGNERYLTWICKFLEAYIASSDGGMGAVVNDKGYKDPTSWGCEIQRNTSFLRTSDNLSVLFRDYREQIDAMGFEHLSMLFCDGAVSLGEEGRMNIPFPYATQNVYELDGTKAMFAMNIIPEGAQKDDESWAQTLSISYNDMNLWQGVRNVLSSPYAVTLEETLDFKEYMCGIQRPVCVDELVGKAEAEILEYSKEKIQIQLNGDFEATLKLRDGIFRISDENGYSVSASSEIGGIVLTVTPGGQTKPKNGELTVKLNGNGQFIDNVGLSILEKTSLKGMPLEQILNREVLEDVIYEVYGYEIELESETPTWAEFSEALVGTMAAAGGNILKNAGLHVVSEGAENTSVSDAQAVKYAADVLEVRYSGEVLKSDVYLTDISIHDTAVKWTSDRPDILDADGILHRENIDCDEITLTAEVMKGEAVYKREFLIPLDRNIDITIQFDQAYNSERNMQSLLRQEGQFDITFTLTANRDVMDTIVSVGSSAEKIAGNGDIPYCVRFSSAGIIDGYNGIAYAADNTLKYQKGKKYHIRMAVNLEKETYDLYVTPDGEEEVLIGKDYQRRQRAKAVSTIDQIWVWDRDGDSLSIADISYLSPRKGEPVDTFVKDYQGNSFHPYLPLTGYQYPYFSDSGKVINWQTIFSRAKRSGEYMTVHLGAERLSTLQLSLMEVLKDCRILTEDIRGEDFVTPASLVRPLNLK